MYLVALLCVRLRWRIGSIGAVQQLRHLTRGAGGGGSNLLLLIT